MTHEIYLLENENQVIQVFDVESFSGENFSRYWKWDGQGNNIQVPNGAAVENYRVAACELPSESVWPLYQALKAFFKEHTTPPVESAEPVKMDQVSYLNGKVDALQLVLELLNGKY